MKFAVAVFVLFFLSSVAFPATIFVPNDFPTIQDAIQNSASGDTIIVRPGKYVEKIDFVGKAITVKSEKGASVTTIDGNGAGSVVTFQTQEGSGSILKGFTLKNGSGTTIGGVEWGGGILCYSQSSPILKELVILDNDAVVGGGICCYDFSFPAITDCSISGNSASYAGGGIACQDSSSPIVSGNEIAGNSASDYGGGISCVRSSPTITGNTLSSNSAFKGGGGIYCETSSPAVVSNTIKDNSAFDNGGGLHFFNSSQLTVANNTILKNTALHGGGIYCSGSSPNITCNTIIANSAPIEGGGITSVEQSHPRVTNSILRNNSTYEIVVGNNFLPSDLSIARCNLNGGTSSCYVWSSSSLIWGGGMIDVDPLFVNAGEGDFHLSCLSQCRNAGDNGFVTEQYDFEGDPRIANGQVDIGADEFHPHLYTMQSATPGALIDIKIIGTPKLPVILGLGSGIQSSPVPTPHGEFWLKLPLLASWNTPPIPSSGVFVFTAYVPSGWPSGSQYPFQALVGPWGGGATRLTNAMVIEVQ